MIFYFIIIIMVLVSQLTTKSFFQTKIYCRYLLFIPAAQDYDLWIRIAELGDVYYISEPLQKYYVYSGERISNSSSKKIKGYSKLLEKYSEIASNNRSFFTNKHIVLSYHYYNLGDNENGKPHFFSSVKSIPTTVDFVYYVLKIVKIKLSNK